MDKITHAVFARPINQLLVISFFLISLIPITVLGIKVYNAAWENAWREINEKHRLLAMNMAEPIRIYMADKRRMMGILTQSLADGVQRGDNPSQVHSIIENARLYFEDFSSLALVNTQGKAICFVASADNHIAGAENTDIYKNNLTVQTVKKTREWTVSDVERSKVTGKPTIFIGYPLQVKNTLHGVLVAELKLDEIERLRRNIHFGEKGHSAIVDSKGRALAHPNPGWVNAIKDLSHVDIVQKMISGNTGVTEFYSPHVKQTMVAGYTFVPDLGWGIMVPQPKPEVEKQVEHILFSQLSWALLGLVAALSIAVIIARKITNPINQLATAARNVVLNEYEDKLPHLTRNVPLEIQELNNALVNLVSGLQVSHSEIHQLNTSLQKRVEDATEKLRLSNEQLKSHAAEVELANKTKSDFLANISHELRTPLNAIIGYTELLSEEIQETGNTDYLSDLEKIDKSSRHLLSLINDILDISKIESGKVDVESEDVSIHEILTEVEKTVSPLIKEKNNLLAIHFNTAVDSIVADRKKLYQILLNLISNANKFTDEGEIEVDISNIMIASHEWITISVRDTGIGISEEQQRTIFTAFNQANSGISRKYGGTGLGLAISREYARMMSGDIVVESVPGEGANFTLTIPVKP